MADPIIIPGPWSFLQGLVPLAQNLHAVREEKRQQSIADEERKRLHTQQDLQTFLQLLPYIQQGGGQGGNPGIGPGPNPQAAPLPFSGTPFDPFAQPRGGDPGLPAAAGQVPNSGLPIPPNIQAALGNILGNPNVQLGPSANMRLEQFNLSRAPIEAAQKDRSFEQQSALNDVNIAEAKQKWDVMKNLSKDQLESMWNIPGDIELATENDKQLQEVARRFVFTAGGDAKAAFAAASLQPKTRPFVKAGKLTEDFFGAAAQEYKDEQRKLDIEMQRALAAGGRYKTPQEYLDDLYRNTTAERNSKINEWNNYTIAGKILDAKDKARADQLQKEISTLDRQIDLIRGAFVNKMGVPIAAGNPDVKQNPTAPGAQAAATRETGKVSVSSTTRPPVRDVVVQDAAAKIKARQGTIDQLQQAVGKPGGITQEEFDAIKKLLEPSVLDKAKSIRDSAAGTIFGPRPK